MAHGELAWFFLEPDTGLDHCLRILLSCFRARTSGTERKRGREEGSKKIAVLQVDWTSDETPMKTEKQRSLL